MACHGTHAIVFAQLELDGPRGVHAFLVQIRNDDSTLTEGVHIEDCGPKCALNGIDNGKQKMTSASFNVRVLILTKIPHYIIDLTLSFRSTLAGSQTNSS